MPTASTHAIGASLAVYGTSWITDAIPADNRQYLRNYGRLTVDRTVVLFALGVGALCGAVFGSLPAWTGARADLNADLRNASARATAGRAGTRLRSGLVVAQVRWCRSVGGAAASNCPSRARQTCHPPTRR